MPYAEDPLAVLADLVIKQATALPDLTRSVILMPDLQAAPQLRRLLLDSARQQGHGALLGPTISTLRHWMRQQHPARRRLLSNHARELLLVEALMEHAALLRNNSPWALAENLLLLFDELTLQGTTLPGDTDSFIQELADAYGVDAQTCRALSDEARLVHTLWLAYHQQLDEQRMCDETTAYRDALISAINVKLEFSHYYLAGFDRFLRTELHWIKPLLNGQRLTLIMHGQPQTAVTTDIPQPDTGLAETCHELDLATSTKNTGTENTCTAFLNAAYAPLTANDDEKALIADFKQRATLFRQQHSDSPVTSRLYLFAARGAEQEAQAVDLQVRRWLLEGRQRIGIVTEDRRLARRVRALLERANIRLHDAAGWALSTTSAGAALERWLQTVEEDFAHAPLLDFLKSAFVLPEWDEDRLKSATFRLEQDIIHKENVGRDLGRYRRHVYYRQRRLPWKDNSVSELLDALETAADPLRSLAGTRRYPPEKFLDALDASLLRLGMDQQLEQDPAGTQVLEQLAQMRAALAGRNLRIHWQEFRAWLGRQLEQANFRPQTGGDNVQLLGLGQSHLCRFDALIFAGADREHLPRHGHESPFFNDAVRHELGISSNRDRLQSQFYHFRRLLEAAPMVLITLCRERNGEPVLPSPWVEILRSFHQLGYQQPLDDNGIGDLVGLPDTTIAARTSHTSVEPYRMPTPTLERALLPDTISATSYQQLVNCPYQFFALSCLQLRAPDYLREMLQKDEYGQKIHRVLEAFHGGRKGLPGPFNEPFTTATRSGAIALLEQISRQEFASNLEDNFLHRGWLKRWLAVVPAYIDWQIERAHTWRIDNVEYAKKRKSLVEGFRVTGRLDRIDWNNDGFAVLDYKTGAVPKTADVASGEAVQLPFYAMLLEEPVVRVEYLSLDKDVKTEVSIEGESLRDLRLQNERRLIESLHEIQTGAPLPAWGDGETCRYCPAIGICRRQTWIDDMNMDTTVAVAHRRGARQ